MNEAIVPEGFVSTGVRFLTQEEAEAYLFGTAPTHPIYEGSPDWESANFEIGLMVMQDSFKRLIPANPAALQPLSPIAGTPDTPKPKEPLKGAEIL